MLNKVDFNKIKNVIISIITAKRVKKFFFLDTGSNEEREIIKKKNEYDKKIFSENYSKSLLYIEGTSINFHQRVLYLIKNSNKKALICLLLSVFAYHYTHNDYYYVSDEKSIFEKISDKFTSIKNTAKSLSSNSDDLYVVDEKRLMDMQNSSKITSSVDYQALLPILYSDKLYDKVKCDFENKVEFSNSVSCIHNGNKTLYSFAIKYEDKNYPISILEEKLKVNDSEVVNKSIVGYGLENIAASKILSDSQNQENQNARYNYIDYKTVLFLINKTDLRVKYKDFLNNINNKKGE